MIFVCWHSNPNLLPVAVYLINARTHCMQIAVFMTQWATRTSQLQKVSDKQFLFVFIIFFCNFR